MKRILTLVLTTFFGYLTTQAQIQVYSNNNVSVGATSANGKFVVSTSGSTAYNAAISTPTAGNVLSGTLLITNSANISGNFNGLVSSASWDAGGTSIVTGIYGYAIKSNPSTSGRATGVMGMAGNATAGYNYGVTGWLYGSNNGTAIFGSSTPAYVTINDKYAGYFNGKVYINGKTDISGELWVDGKQVTTSDERIKEDISELDSTEAIFALKPVKYHVKNKAERRKLFQKNNVKAQALTNQGDTAKVVPIEENEVLPQKKQYGFLAQDLQKVYPDLVYESAEGMLGIDYQGLIPVIVEQLKKMKESMDAKNARIEALEKEMKKLKKGKQ